MKRIVWVDNAKAIAIYLVVLGHFHYAYAPLPFKDVIYAFHIPAFLFITGFLLPETFRELPARRFFERYIALYLRAYAFFSVLAIGIWWAAETAGAGGPVNPWPAIAGTLRGVSGQGGGLVHHDAPLWYFPFLVTAMIATFLVTRVPPVLGAILALLYAAFGFLYSGPRLPWCLDIAGIGASFILAGHLFRRVHSRIAPALGARATWIAVPALLAALVVIARADGQVNINGAEFGNSPALFYLAAFVGIALLIVVAALSPASRLATAISLETLTIFALHIYLIMVFARLPHPETGLGATLGAILLAALATLICLGLARALRPVLDRLVTR